MFYYQRSASLARKSQTAFTLIELLVVIAIIAILAAILFPVFAQAKESAKKANCISNLKNISIATVLYVADFDDTIPLSYYVNSNGNSSYPYHNQFYFGYKKSTLPNPVIDYSLGIIYPYIKNGIVIDCPSLDSSQILNRVSSAGSTSGSALAGYAVNIYNGTEGVEFAMATGGDSMSSLEAPAETFLLGDMTRWIDASNPMQKTYIAFPGYGGIYFWHGRHNGMAGIGWFDGHAKAIRPSAPSFGNGTLTYSDMSKRNLGYINKFPPLTTTLPTAYIPCPSANSAFYDLFGKCSDWYYFSSKKPLPGT